MIDSRYLCIIFVAYVTVFFVVGCAKNDVVIEPVTAIEAKRNLDLRAKYETLLFNRLRVRGESNMKNRFESIQNMAKDGFKPAALALALYDIEHTDLKKNDIKAERALENLAESGDVTAQCLYAVYWMPEHNLNRWRHYVINSANAEVPKCMFLRARYVENDKSKEQLDWTYKAALKGDSSGQTLMAYAYYQGILLPKDMDRAMCWAAEVKKSGSHYDAGTYENLMFFYRKDKNDFKALPPTSEFCQPVIHLRQ